MDMGNKFVWILAMLLGSALATAQEKRLSAEVLWELDRVGSPVVAPDGNSVVVPVTSYDREDEKDVTETRLWLLSAGTEKSQHPITAAGARASSPVYSPDGSHLAFVSKRGDDEAGQIYVLPMTRPGEARRITEVPTGVSGLRWRGNHIYFMSSVWPGQTWDEMKDTMKTEETDGVSAMEWDALPYSSFDHYLDQGRENHLFRVPGNGGEVEAISQKAGLKFHLDDPGRSHYDVSSDESLIAMVINSSAGEVYSNPDVFLLDMADGSSRNLTSGNPAPDLSPQFSPDGKQLAYQRQNIKGFYGDQHKLMLHDIARDETNILHADWDRSASGLIWANDSRGFYGAIDDAGTRRIYYIPSGRGDPRAITKNTDYGSLAISADGTLIATNQSAVHPNRVVKVNRRNGSIDRLDSFNDETLAEVAVGTYESVTYDGYGGKEIQMWIHYPPGFDPDRSYPLMLLIHGGPHGAITDNFHYRWNAQTFTSWGYVTAWPNFHGSSGFGQDFVDAINPDWITKPYADVIAAADYLIAKPYIDETRTVAAGGSYGGYLSSIVLGREHPFNALMIHAAVYDLYAQMSADFAVNMERFGPYWEKPEIYREQSPHYYAAGFNTPSLVIHGQNDLRVPVGQGFELFRTLQTRGVDSKLIYYPDENHWILKRSNSLHWYSQVRDWFARYAEPGPKSR